MSVILEALQKARSDKKTKGATAGDAGAARVLDPQSGGPVLVSSTRGASAAEGASTSRRSWILATSVMISLLLLLCLIGGMFWLLYDQIRRVNTAPAMATSAPTLAPVVSGPAGVMPGGVPLPTPLPVQELPVQPPKPKDAAVAELPVAAAPAASPTPEFILGSIVCEEGQCLAALNGRSVRIGDVVKGWTVLDISTSGLVLQSANGEQRSLSLFD